MAQGLVNKAVRLLVLIPRDYKGSIGVKFNYDLDMFRERLLCASGKSTGTAPTLKQFQAAYNTHTISASLFASVSVAHVYGYLLHRTINQ